VLNQKIGDRPDEGAWIHSELDDFGLSPAEFRVYCHILRRAGAGGHCWETTENAAKHCRLNRKTYEKAITTLERYGMVYIERRKGQSSIINPLAKRNWSRPTPKEAEGTAQIGVPQNRLPTPKEADLPTPKEADLPTPKEADEVYPYEVNPIEGYPNNKIPPISPQRGEGGALEIFQEEEQKQEVAKVNGTTQAKSNLEKERNTGQDHFSARRRSPSKAIQNINKQYPDELPPWRYGRGVGEYHSGFLEYTQAVLDGLPQDTTAKQLFSAAGLIEHREEVGRFAELNDRCQQWQAKEHRKTNLQVLFEPPLISDVSEAISLIQIHRSRLGWTSAQCVQHMCDRAGWLPDKSINLILSGSRGFSELSEDQIEEMAEVLKTVERALCTKS
jgi:hypothetical protein